MNELALFAGAGRIKPLYQEASWKQNDVVNVLKNFLFPTFTKEQMPSLITLLASRVKNLWLKIGISAIKKKQI